MVSADIEPRRAGVENLTAGGRGFGKKRWNAYIPAIIPCVIRAIRPGDMPHAFSKA
jgi:hypothetical protein